MKLKPLERYGPGMCRKLGRQCVVNVVDGTARRERCSLRWYATCSGANEYGHGRVFSWGLAWENYPLFGPDLPKQPAQALAPTAVSLPLLEVLKARQIPQFCPARVDVLVVMAGGIFSHLLATLRT